MIKFDTMEAEFRIKEYRGKFTIQRKYVTHKKKFLRGIEETIQWRDIDKFGDYIYIYSTLHGVISNEHIEEPAYDSLSDAEKALSEIKEGIKYHFV